MHTHTGININISKSWSKFELALVTIGHDAPNCNIPSNLKHLLLGVSQQLLKMETEQPKCYKREMLVLTSCLQEVQRAPGLLLSRVLWMLEWAFW